MKQKFSNLFSFLSAVPTLAILRPGNPATDLFVDPSTTGGGTVQGMILWILGIMMGLLGAISMFFLILGAYYYLVSGANEDLATKGKSMMTNAVIGFVIAVFSYAILTVVQQAVRGTV